MFSKTSIPSIPRPLFSTAAVARISSRRAAVSASLPVVELVEGLGRVEDVHGHARGVVFGNAAAHFFGELDQHFEQQQQNQLIFEFLFR